MVLIPRKSTYLFLFLLISFQLNACAQKPAIEEGIKTGADNTELYLSALKGKRIAIVANQTSVILKKEGEKEFTHLVDSLLTLNFNIKKVFAPEHGFRGKADAGEVVKDGFDTKTGLPIISLYGKNKKPTKQQLEGIDLVVFDIQDVGARFYTYISSLHYVMEACAEANIPVILLDRPNPNGHYVDGPVLEKKHKSFVGMHPVPVVYGMTIGEYGKMINGEKWLANGIQCDLTVIGLKNYTHQSNYSLPIKPSPNLPNDQSINLYPSLCFFEGTTVNAGRGTNMQFQIYGSPYLDSKNAFSYIPVSNPGAKYPKHKNKTCFGEDLRNEKRLDVLDLSWLIKAQAQNSEEPFFNAFFTKLAGTKALQEQITKGISEKEIRASWKIGLDRFKKIRENYLLYD